MSAFEILGDIIPDLPATRIMLVTDSNSSLLNWLASFIEQREASLDIRILNQEVFNEIKELKLDEKKLITLEFLEHASQTYNPHSYKLDALFLYLENEVLEKKHLLERVYAGMKNAGGVVVIVSNSNPMANTIEVDLEGANFVAINSIEILKTHKVYYAKKMHGWGGAR